MFRIGILAILWSTMTCSLGFTMDRSALASSTWDTAPSLDTYQRVLDPALNGKMQVTGMDKILQAVDAKVSTKLANGAPENQTRDKRSTMEHIGTETKLVVADTALATNNDAPDLSEKRDGAVVAARNVVLLLIDERDQDEKQDENSWRNCKEKLPFAIEGLLQTCRDKVQTAGLSAESTLVSQNKEDCECERLLRLNIRELISWAKNERGMTTGVISSSNFSLLPFSPRYESSNGVPIDFNGSSENDAKLEPGRSKRNANDAWQVIDLGDRAKSVPPLLLSDSKTVGASYDSTWDIYDVFSKIRMALFRFLLESVGRNDSASEDEFLLHGPIPLKPTVANLIENTINELKSVPSDRGYLLIAVAPRSELAAVIDLLRRETSPTDTLLIVTQICFGDKKPIPFIARGPSIQVLQEVRMIWDLPAVIKKAVTGDCRGCANRPRRNIPFISHAPIEIFSQEVPTRKRVIRNKEADKKQSAASTVKATTTEKDKQIKRSLLSETTPHGIVTMLGSATSVLVTTSSALTSS